MEITVKDLSKLVNGKVKGDQDLIIKGFSPIDEAEEGSLSFLANPKYYSFLYSTKASAVLVNDTFAPESNTHPTLIFVQDVYSTLSILLEKFNHNANKKRGIEHYSHIEASANLGKDVYVGAFAYIGKNVILGNGVKVYPHCYIGDNTVIEDKTVCYSGVRIYDGCEVGKSCILHSGCVIGGDGFGFAPQNNGSYKKLPQTGNVKIEDNVEIGANTTIDRATMQSTIIREGVKLDNLIQVAHNVEIGKNTAIAAQSGISGSTKIGKNCIIGGQVGFVGHITIADGTKIGAQSGVSNSIREPDKKWFGSPVKPLKQAIKSSIIFKKLPELYKRIRKLEKRLDQNKSASREK